MNRPGDLPRLIIGVLLLLAGLTAIVIGRYVTFHDTEGEAFVNGWPYWLAGLVGLFLGARFIHDAYTWMRTKDWIPVSECLPEPGTRVLMVIKGGHGQRYVAIALVDNERQFWNEDCDDRRIPSDNADRPTHWMPIPDCQSLPLNDD